MGDPSCFNFSLIPLRISHLINETTKNINETKKKKNTPEKLQGGTGKGIQSQNGHRFGLVNIYLQIDIFLV